MRSIWSWLVVTVVGAFVIVLVLALQLFPRLDAGQDVIDEAEPVFTTERVAGTDAGVTIVSDIVDLADPITRESGGGAAEVNQLVAFVGQRANLPPEAVLAALQQNAPKTTALLQAIPLQAVNAELPALVNLLSTTLGLPPDQVTAALDQNFPRLAQTIAALPKVVNGWDNVPGTDGFTRFDGAEQVRTVPQVRDYFAGDVVPLLTGQEENVADLADKGGVGFLPLLLLIVGIVVLLFGILMMVLVRKDAVPQKAHAGAWGVVVVVGAVVTVLVFALSLFGRLDGGAELIDEAEPLFTDERVAGTEAGVGIVSDIVDLADPITLESGGGAAEVGQLVTFVSQRANLPPDAVLAAMTQAAPKTTALLQAIPLEAVNAELPALVTLLSTTLGLPPDQVTAALDQNFPRLAQTIAALPKVVDGWDSVPGTEGFTRIDTDEPIRTVPEVRDYFAGDVVPFVTGQADNFEDLADPWPDVDVFPPLLLVVGIIVIIFGLLNLVLVLRAPARRG